MTTGIITFLKLKCLRMLFASSVMFDFDAVKINKALKAFTKSDKFYSKTVKQKKAFFSEN